MSVNVSSSQDLHPDNGGRFVLTRVGDAYRVEVFLPAGRKLESTLRFDEGGRALLEPALEDTWAHEETLKLARVLKRSPKAVLSRWRG